VWSCADSSAHSQAHADQATAALDGKSGIGRALLLPPLKALQLLALFSQVGAAPAAEVPIFGALHPSTMLPTGFRFDVLLP
jgi:hypothetical protein